MRCAIFSVKPYRDRRPADHVRHRNRRCLVARPADRLAAGLARAGNSEPIHIEETDTTLAIGWKGRYRIDGPAFVYADNDSGRVTTILGYPTDQLAEIC
jgi:hypothetical protein